MCVVFPFLHFCLLCCNILVFAIISKIVDEDWDKLDHKAVSMIILSLLSNFLFNVSTQKIANGLWDHLSYMYEMPST
jgi:hypothetical protein